MVGTETEEVQGVVEVKIEGAESGESILLRHLSGSEAATLVQVLFPVEKVVGTLRSVTLIVADAKQAEVVTELIRGLDVPGVTNL